ncbi:MAG: hypothetical protein K2Z80_30350 [Xanthobacteraceae bacterium]|nr:hypothetical protein [Xanthobacteraceae bacterium]
MTPIDLVRTAGPETTVTIREFDQRGFGALGTRKAVSLILAAVDRGAEVVFVFGTGAGTRYARFPDRKPNPRVRPPDLTAIVRRYVRADNAELGPGTFHLSALSMPLAEAAEMAEDGLISRGSTVVIDDESEFADGDVMGPFGPLVTLLAQGVNVVLRGQTFTAGTPVGSQVPQLMMLAMRLGEVSIGKATSPEMFAAAFGAR